MLYYVGPEVAFASGWGDRWYPTVEGVWGLGTGAITVRAPRGWRVITGADADGTREEEAGTFRFSQRLATYFTFVAGPYSLAESYGGGKRQVTAWQLTPRPHMPHLLAGVADMMGVLEAEFGPYPFGRMALVEVPRSLARAAGFNAFSPTGFIVVNSRSFDAKDAKYQYEWLGHEMGHQWFPHAVTFDRARLPVPRGGAG
jgi:aminopeptidase N